MVISCSIFVFFLYCYYHRFQLFEVTQGVSHGEGEETICEMPIAAFVKPTLMDSPSNDVHFTDQSSHPDVLPLSTRPAQDVALPQQVYRKLPSRVSSWRQSSQIQHSNVMLKNRTCMGVAKNTSLHLTCQAQSPSHQSLPLLSSRAAPASSGPRIGASSRHVHRALRWPSIAL